jgi:asparagine synthase (glutamine-hydrolysing)
VSPSATASPRLLEAAGHARDLLDRAVAHSPAQAILLSGGLDTSIVAELSAPRGLSEAFTVLASPRATDGPYAAAVARAHHLDQKVIALDFPALLEMLHPLVRTLRSFDPMEVRNSLVIARALEEAKGAGVHDVLTGDGADELFAGYSYLWGLEPVALRSTLDHLARVMRFSSFPLAERLGIRVHAPFLDPAVVEFASRLGKGELVGEREGVVFGKLVLREAFPELPQAWRRKDPIEVGSGSAGLPEYFRERTSPTELGQEIEGIRKRDRVEIRDAEHLAYYRAFREEFPDLDSLGRWGRDPCPHCGFELSAPDSNFCVTCGAWPARG